MRRKKKQLLRHNSKDAAVRAVSPGTPAPRCSLAARDRELVKNEMQEEALCLMLGRQFPPPIAHA
jgi:hypothetical protein